MIHTWSCTLCDFDCLAAVSDQKLEAVIRTKLMCPRSRSETVSGVALERGRMHIAVSATPPSQIHLPEWMALVLDEDEQGGKLSSSNMLGQLAKRYQDKPSSLSWIHGLSYWTEWGHSLMGQTHTSSFNHLSSSRTSSSLKCMSFHFILSCWIESQLVPFFSIYVARHGIGLSITLY